jgi:hypothetical protein
VGCVIGAARERKIIQGSAPQFEPFQQTRANVIHQFELDWPAGLLLYDRSPRPYFSVTNDVADPDLDQITPA